MAQEPPRTNAQSLKVEDLVDRVLRGAIRIPEFQRPLRWKKSDNIALLDSVLRGYPIGALLFWEQQAPAAHLTMGELQIDAVGLERAWFIVDGQQRITALVSALAPSTSLTAPVGIWLDLDSEKFVTTQTDTTVPTHELGDAERLLAWLDQWPKRASRGDLVKRAYALSKRLREYQLPAYVVETPDESIVATIFDRLNTKGKQLKRAEVFKAIERSTGAEPGRLEQIQRRLTKLEFGEVRVETVLQAVQAVAGFDINKPPPRDWPKRDQTQAFSDAAEGLAATIVFLKRDLGIPHVALLPYSLPLVVLAKFFHFYTEPSHRSRTLLGRWFWRATVAGALRGDNLPLVARFMQAVRSGDEERVVQALLGTATTTSAPPLQDNLNLRGAATKVEILLLVRLRPRHLLTGAELDVTKLLSKFTLSQLLPHLVPKSASVPFVASLANRIFHPPLAQGLAHPRSELVAKSHALLLTPGSPHELLATRAEFLNLHLYQWLSDVMGVGQSDRGSIARLAETEEPS